MTTDRSIRSLTGLNAASSSRVLNLVAIAHANAGYSGHKEAPLFRSNVLNSSIVLKHRLRQDEIGCFEQCRAVATKIIVPFQKAELKMGGQSLFIGQRSFENMILDLGNYRDGKDIERDFRVLKLLDAVPSLDPFILREYLRSNAITPDECYFRISPPEQRRMHEYAAAEVGRLTAMVSGTSEKKLGVSAEKMVGALLSNEANERLEPLRVTLNLASSQFSEGIFAWRGFIYYKWSLEEFWPRLMEVLRSIKAARPKEKIDAEKIAFLESSKNSILLGARSCADEVREVIGIYDSAYATLIDDQNPKLFREFLLNAPSLFLEFGEKIGAMSHIASFWQYRFPKGGASADADELSAIFEDFSRSLGREKGSQDVTSSSRGFRLHVLNC